MAFLLQSSLLLLSFAFVFLWQLTPLSQYTIQTLGLLIFIYLVIYLSKKKTLQGEGGLGEVGNVFILNSIILLLIFSTGGFSSMLFFLIYFMCFGIAFVFAPQTVFVFVVGVVLVFLPDALRNEVTSNMLKLGSVLLISPLAFFFGAEYRSEEEQKEKAMDAANSIASDVAEVLHDETKNLNSQTVEKLNDILETTEDLRQKAR